MGYATIHDCRHALAVLEYIHSDQRDPVVMYQAGIMRIKIKFVNVKNYLERMNNKI